MKDSTKQKIIDLVETIIGYKPPINPISFPIKEVEQKVVEIRWEGEEPINSLTKIKTSHEFAQVLIAKELLKEVAKKGLIEYKKEIDWENNTKRLRARLLCTSPIKIDKIPVISDDDLGWR